MEIQCPKCNTFISADLEAVMIREGKEEERGARLRKTAYCSACNVIIKGKPIQEVEEDN